MVLACQLGFCKNCMNLSVANAMQHGSMTAAVGLWNQVVFIAL
jgi:hypothetical protein